MATAACRTVPPRPPNWRHTPPTKWPPLYTSPQSQQNSCLQRHTMWLHPSRRSMRLRHLGHAAVSVDSFHFEIHIPPPPKKKGGKGKRSRPRKQNVFFKRTGRILGLKLVRVADPFEGPRDLFELGVG
jgi:hypothetical protein